MSKSSSFTIGIVGATGAVGQELLQLLHGRNFPFDELRLYASARSAGKQLTGAGRTYTVAEARAAVAAFPGAELVDDPATRKYPTPLDFTRQAKCGVGRIRLDTAFDNGLAFWVSGDNLWKGAALNAVQNAELMIREGWLQPKSR